MTSLKRQSGPIVLAIIDGWGLSPTWKGNAISFTNPPAMDRLWREYPHAILQAFQPLSQVKRHQIGSSDIGHAMIGSGRHIRSDLEEIVEAISSDVFSNNPILIDTMRAAVQKKRPLHLIGLASNGGIHSDLAVVQALLQLAAHFQIPKVYLHLISDGRDVAPTSGWDDYQTIEHFCVQAKTGMIASIVGRYYAMDRDHHWDRSLAAYQLWVEGRGQLITKPDQVYRQSYEQGLTDEYLPPTRLTADPAATIQNGDSVIIWNGRADRLRQIVESFTNPRVFSHGFGRKSPLRRLEKFVTLISPSLNQAPIFDIAFPPAKIPTTLPQILSNRGLKQLRVAESEKYAHISYFFSGGREEPFPGEERLIVPSPRTKSYDRVPGTATPEIIRKLRDLLPQKAFDFIAINFGNVDLVGHTGNLFATAEAIRITDKAIHDLSQLVLKLDGILLITADHGNAEQMIKLPRQHSARSHTINPVPLIVISNNDQRDLIKQATTPPPTMLADLIRSRATLADIAPTILDLFSIPVPVEMTGHSLLEELH